MQNKNLFYQDQKKFCIVSKIQQHHYLQGVNRLFSSCKQTIYNLQTVYLQSVNRLFTDFCKNAQSNSLLYNNIKMHKNQKKFIFALE